MEKENERNGLPSVAVADISVLPEECISDIISLTTPKDACRACAVSPIFRAAAKSNAVWERFLPSDYQAIIARSSSSSSSSSSLDSLNISSKKHLYLSLSDNPILIDDNKKCFYLDKLSGKKCYRLSARDLCIIWGDTPQHWRWVPHSKSRFPEVAELNHVWWFDIRGKMHTSMLSPKTNYATYLVFKMSRRAYGFTNPPPKASVGNNGEDEGYKQTVCLGMPGVEPSLQDQVVLPQQHTSHPKLRKDGWLEIELGGFLNEGGEDDELQILLREVEAGTLKSGLIVEGIEIRPTKG